MIDDPRALRAMLRTDLIAAMKAREPESVTALRTALAAIDNAEAVDMPENTKESASGSIAGATTGVGSTEAARRDLSIDDLRAILAAQVADTLAAAGQYDTYGQHDAAGRLRREADVFRKYLDR